MKPNVFLKSRYVWLTETDWKSFSDILSENIPSVSYYADRGGAPQSVVLPVTRTEKHLLDVDTSCPGWDYARSDIRMTFEPEWQPDYRLRENDVAKDRGSYWALTNAVLPNVMFRMWAIYTPDRLHSTGHMIHNDVIFYGRSGNREDRLLSQRFFRLLGKVSTNRDQITISMPERKFMQAEAKGSLFWLGHDALRWARENPERVFFYNSRDWAIRPAA